MERMHLDSSMHVDIGRPAANFCPAVPYAYVWTWTEEETHSLSPLFSIRSSTCRVNESRSFLREALSYDVLHPRRRLPTQTHAHMTKHERLPKKCQNWFRNSDITCRCPPCPTNPPFALSLDTQTTTAEPLTQSVSLISRGGETRRPSRIGRATGT